MTATGSQATSVAEFLAEQPLRRRVELTRVIDTVRRNIQRGFEERVGGGKVVYQVPLERYPDTYNGQPLWFAAIAAPKSYLTLHLMPLYGSPKLLARLRSRFEAAGKKLDIGKACIRFTSADDLALDSIGEIVASLSVDQWVSIADSARREAIAARRTGRSRARKKPSNRKD